MKMFTESLLDFRAILCVTAVA